MGSSFSVVNDTKEQIWVSHGVCKMALFSSIAGVLAVATAGASLACSAAAGAGATVGGITAAGWLSLGTVSGLLAAGRGITAGLCGEEKQKVLSAKKELEEKLKGFSYIEPGEKYEVEGTVSLVLTAYVIYDSGQDASHDCWTGPTDGSENLYPVTEYF